jgi:hypothetical protein
MDGSARRYQHRFVWFDTANVLRSVSRQFYFHVQGAEYAAGLAWHPDRRRLLISYGVADREAWIATVDARDVHHALTGPHNKLGVIAKAADPLSQQ